MSCCTNTLDLGCFRFTDFIEIIQSPPDDTYVVTFENVTAHTVSIPTGGGSLEYTDAGVLQPGYTYIVTVKDGAGDPFTDTVDTVVYDCWKFTYLTETTL